MRNYKQKQNSTDIPKFNTPASAQPSKSKVAMIEESKFVSDTRMSLIDRATQYFKKSFRTREESRQGLDDAQNIANSQIFRGISLRKPKQKIRELDEDRETMALPATSIPEAETRHTQIIPEALDEQPSLALTLKEVEQVCSGEIDLQSFDKRSVFKTLFETELIQSQSRSKFW